MSGAGGGHLLPPVPRQTPLRSGYLLSSKACAGRVAAANASTNAQALSERRLLIGVPPMVGGGQVAESRAFAVPNALIRCSGSITRLQQRATQPAQLQATTSPAASPRGQA